MDEFNKTVFDVYTTEQLKKLYKSFTLYMTTDFFIRCLKKEDKDYIVYMDISLDDEYDTYKRMSAANALCILGIEEKINNGLYKTENEKTTLNNKKTALQACNNTLFWCGGGIDLLEENYSKGRKVRNPKDVKEELHINDNIYRQNGHPTEEEVYRFIWEELRMCDLEELKKLLKYADKKFENIHPGRPINKYKILKYDLKGNLIDQYDNRAECMEKNDIKKSMMSQLISGKKRTHKGFKYVEMKMNIA